MAGNDHLSNEVRIEARLTETGLSANATSRTVAAIDRVIGACIDVPAAKMEALANRIRNQGRLESTTYDAAVERVGAAIGSNADALRLVDEVAVSQIQAIANKKHVVNRAVEYLASPSSDTPPEPESDVAELDPDWINYFSGYAEMANSEKVRDLWARVLAGEIRGPGSFSRATLRFLAELDQQMASCFQQDAEFRYQGNFILRPNNLSGERLERLTFLEEVGLIQHVPPVGGMVRKIEPGSSEMIGIFEEDLCLQIQTARPVEVKVIPITRIGQEISRILPPVDPMVVLRQLGEALRNRDEIKSMSICRVVSRDQDGGTRISAPLEVLKLAASVDRS